MENANPTPEEKPEEDPRDYVVDMSEGIELDDEFFYGKDNKYNRENYMKLIAEEAKGDKVKLFSPTLFFGVIILIVATCFGLYAIANFGH